MLLWYALVTQGVTSVTSGVPLLVGSLPYGSLLPNEKTAPPDITKRFPFYFQNQLM